MIFRLSIIQNRKQWSMYKNLTTPMFPFAVFPENNFKRQNFFVGFHWYTLIYSDNWLKRTQLIVNCVCTSKTTLGVNFINILPANFSYKHCFGSFSLVTCVSRKNCQKDFRMKNLCIQCWWNLLQVSISFDSTVLFATST